MANDLRSNIWIVDTASANPITSARVHVRGFVWHKMTDPSHACIIKDYRGKEIVNWTADVSLAPRSVAYVGPAGIPFDGLAITTLGSGEVQVIVA